MARISREEKSKRIRDTEKAILALGRTSAVCEVLAKKYRVNERTVRNWIAEVREEWVKLAVEEEKKLGMPIREARRIQVREMLLEIHAKAQARTRAILDKNGQPVKLKDAKGNERVAREPHPNMSASLQVMRQLRLLDALDAPKVKIHQHMGGIADKDPHGERSEDEWRFFLSNGRFPTKRELAAISVG